MYDFVRDGKFYKNTRGKGGRSLECEVVQCRCGAWASTNLVHTRHHLGSPDHRQWATDHGEALVDGYRKRAKTGQATLQATAKVAHPLPRSPDQDDDSSALLSKDDKPPSPYLGPEWYADEEGVWINPGIYEDDAQLVDRDRFFKDFETYRIHDDIRYAEVHDARQELRCRDANPWRSGKEVFFHHSELSLECLMTVLEFYTTLPATNKECAERLYRFHVFQEVLKESWDKYTAFFDDEEFIASKEEEYTAFVASVKSIVDGKVGLIDPETAHKQEWFPATKEECAVKLVVLYRIEDFLKEKESVDKQWLSLVL
jgi:hypothetical protein